MSKYILMMFFHFLKIIFDISTSKRSKTYKLYSILTKKKSIFLEMQVEPRSQTLPNYLRYELAHHICANVYHVVWPVLSFSVRTFSVLCIARTRNPMFIDFSSLMAWSMSCVISKDKCLCKTSVWWSCLKHSC